MSLEQSSCGWMFRLFEVLPTSNDRAVSGTVTGSPGEGHGSSASCWAYQSGSTQSSATQAAPPPPPAASTPPVPGIGGAIDGSPAAACTGASAVTGPLGA